MSIDVKRTRLESWPAAVFALIMRVLLLAAVGYALYRMRFIIVMVLLAVMLSLALAPVVDWLRDSPILRPLPFSARRVTATWIVFLLLAVAVVATAVLVFRPVAGELRQFATNWKEYQERLGTWLATVQEQYRGMLPDETRAWIEGQVRVWSQDRGAHDVGSAIAGQLQGLLRHTIESSLAVVELILVPVLAFSFLTESRPLKREVLNFVPYARLRDTLYVMGQTGGILQSYAIAQLILALIAGVVVWLLMTLLGSKYAIALATIAALTRVIPVIGPIVGAVPIVLISALGQGWDKGLVVLVAFTLMHLVESKVVMPRLIGYRIKLHPALVIIALLIGAEFFGMWGMFLAAPVAAVLKVLVHHVYVRPRLQHRAKPSPPGPYPRPIEAQEERELERPAVAGVGSRSGAH